MFEYVILPHPRRNPVSLNESGIPAYSQSAVECWLGANTDTPFRSGCLEFDSMGHMNEDAQPVCVNHKLKDRFFILVLLLRST